MRFLFHIQSTQEKKPIDFKFCSLYRGLMVLLMGVGLEKSIVFGTYEAAMKKTNNYVVRFTNTTEISFNLLFLLYLLIY